MPNWCQNKLWVKGPKETIAKIVNETKLDQDEFDFNSIVPMPEELNIACSSSVDWGMDILYGNWSRFLELPAWRDLFLEITDGHLPETREEMISLIENEYRLYRSGKRLEFSFDLKGARQAKANIEKYGSKDWYDWRFANWGTKFNSRDVGVERIEDDSFLVFFNTAWSPPVPVFEALCKKYQEITAKLSFLETGNWFAGVARNMEDGEVFVDYIAEDLIKEFAETEFEIEFDDEDEYEEEEEMAA